MKKRSIAIKGHRTSILLEPEFWDALERLARADGRSLPALIADIDARRTGKIPPQGLASALRVYALERCSSSPALRIRNEA
ncbi:MAG: ribbon-helix-helix domain-containing protein [Amphiplicatus sp.]